MYQQIFEEARRQHDCEVAKQKAMQEQIVPFNRDIDNSLREAISELQTQHNSKIAQLQQAFENEKKVLAEAAAKKKSGNTESVIASAVSVINAEADTAIAKLRELVGEGA